MYPTRPATASNPPVDAMFTIDPPPEASMAGISYFIARKTPPQANGEGAVVVAYGQLGQRGWPVATAGGVVDRGIQPAVGPHGLLHQPADRRRITDVGRHGKRLAAAGDDLVGDHAQGWFGPRRHHDGGSGRAQRPGGR